MALRSNHAAAGEDSRAPTNSVTQEELASVLVALGCPADKSLSMAGQLDKRARQLTAEKGKSYEEALAHLLSLMKKGWAAKERGL